MWLATLARSSAGTKPNRRNRSSRVLASATQACQTPAGSVGEGCILPVPEHFSPPRLPVQVAGSPDEPVGRQCLHDAQVFYVLPNVVQLGQVAVGYTPF